MLLLQLAQALTIACVRGCPVSTTNPVLACTGGGAMDGHVDLSR